MVSVLLGTGFEESEAIIPCDLLRRAGIETRLVGIGAREITGGHGITLVADCTLSEAQPARDELLLLPGGLGGVSSILRSDEALQAIQAAYAAGHYIAAICAAPTILAKLGITDARRVTCYPGCEADMPGAIACGENAVTDGRIITGKSAGTAFDFALAIITALRGEEAARQVARQVVYHQEASNV